MNEYQLTVCLSVCVCVHSLQCFPVWFHKSDSPDNRNLGVEPKAPVFVLLTVSSIIITTAATQYSWNKPAAVSAWKSLSSVPFILFDSTAA